jgi:hypothetical protein
MHGFSVDIRKTSQHGSNFDIRFIDTLFLCGIIPLARPTSSMVEQLTLNQQVRGSSPRSVTWNGGQMTVIRYIWGSDSRFQAAGVIGEKNLIAKPAPSAAGAGLFNLM